MFGGSNRPAKTIVGLAGLCVSIAAGFGLGAFAVTGVEPLSARGVSMASVPYEGAERDNRTAAADDSTAATPQHSDWVGEQSGRADTQDVASEF